MQARMDSLTHGSFIWLEAVCAERNVARRYTVALSRDLFGTSIVEFAWGRIGTKGQGRAVMFGSFWSTGGNWGEPIVPGAGFEG